MGCAQSSAKVQPPAGTPAAGAHSVKTAGEGQAGGTKPNDAAMRTSNSDMARNTFKHRSTGMSRPPTKRHRRVMMPLVRCVLERVNH